MPTITVNNISVFLPELIDGSSSGLLPLQTSERVTTVLQGTAFPVLVTDALQANRGELRISYTGNDTPANAIEDIGKVNHRRQGGSFWIQDRTASYQVTVNYYQFSDKTNHPLFVLTCNNTASRSSEAHLHKVNPEEITTKRDRNRQVATAQNNSPLKTFLQDSWSKAGTNSLQQDYSSTVLEVIYKAEEAEQSRVVDTKEGVDYPQLPPPYDPNVDDIVMHASSVSVVPSSVIDQEMPFDVKELREKLDDVQQRIVRMYKEKQAKHNAQLLKGQEESEKQRDKMEFLRLLIEDLTNAQKLVPEHSNANVSHVKANSCS